MNERAARMMARIADDTATLIGLHPEAAKWIAERVGNFFRNTADDEHERTERQKADAACSHCGRT